MAEDDFVSGDEETKVLTPHLSSMTFVDVFVSDAGGGNRHKYVVDLKDGDGMDFYHKVVKDFDYHLLQSPKGRARCDPKTKWLFHGL